MLPSAPHQPPELDLLAINSHDMIEQTLRRVASYPVPVARSCHLGNNGAYNWGWLALARNTRLIMFDHTTYGADKICLPWAILGDRGAIIAMYSITGGEIGGSRGVHVNVATRAISSKYRAILNYSVPAWHGGVPLPAYHYATNLRLARRFNWSLPSYDAREILNNFDLFSSIVVAAHRRRSLDQLFDRWAHTRGDRVVFTKIESFAGRGDHLVVRDPGQRPLFEGPLGELLAQVHESLSRLQAHIEHGKPLDRVAYPWLSLPYAYLFGAATDYARSIDLRTCLHAGGLASPYYMNQPQFRARFRVVYDALARDGFLPQPFRFVLVPIGCCQLFSTSAASPLDDIVERWRQIVASLPERRAILDLLASRAHPFGPELARATRELDHRFLGWLRAEMVRFAEHDVNRLPVCYDAAASDSATFNKYGIGSCSLLQVTPRFSPSLASLTWVEANWLTQVLALLLADYDELRGGDVPLAT
jgi:hypothetical protein